MIDYLPTELLPALRSELRKILGFPGIGWVAAVVAGAALISTLAAALTAGPLDPTGEPATGAASIGLYPAFGVAALAAAVLGVFGTAGEYWNGGMPTTVLFTPNRDRLAAAKLALPAAAGLAAAVLTALIGIGVLAGLGRGKVDVGWSLAAVFGGGLFAAVCWAVIGAGLGLALRSVAGALAVLLGWLVLLEPLIWLVARAVEAEGLVALLPGSATISVVAVGALPESGFLAPTPAAYVVLLLWAAGLGGFGWWTLRTVEL